MAVPYTPDAVKAIRFAFNSGRSRTDIQDHLGWSDSMFDRVCNLHGIEYGRGAQRAVVDADDDSGPTLSAKSVHRVAARRGEEKLPQPNQHTTFTVCLNVAQRNELVRRARQEEVALSTVIRNILLAWLESGAAGRCGIYRGDSRSAYATISIRRSDKDALIAAMVAARHQNLSEFCAAILQRHLASVLVE